MTQQQPAPGWWLASDGRWYPPELAPGQTAPAAPIAAAQAAPTPWGAPTTSAPPAQQSPGGQPPGGQPPQPSPWGAPAQPSPWGSPTASTWASTASNGSWSAPTGPALHATAVRDQASSASARAKGVLAGVVWIAVGVAGSIASMALFDRGYVLFWGPVVVGVITIFKALFTRRL